MTTSIILQPREDGLIRPISEFTFSLLASSSNPEKGDNDRDNRQIFRVPIRWVGSFFQNLLGECLLFHEYFYFNI